jgi:hypothetical protein
MALMWKGSWRHRSWCQVLALAPLAPCLGATDLGTKTPTL